MSVLATNMDDNRNWKEYNCALVNRGRVINIYISADLCKETDLRKSNRGKFGRPYEYTDAVILGAYALKCLFRFGYRQTSGLSCDISNYVKDVATPNFRTIWWRVKKLGRKNFNVTKRISQNGDMEIAIDSTGIKSTGAGEYLTYLYRKKKNWLKLHIVVDVNTHDILNARVTKRKIGDSQKFVELVSPLIKNTKEIYADGGYDSNQIFEYIENKGIYPNIAVHLNSSKKCSEKARRKAVLEQLGLKSKRGIRDSMQNYTREYRRTHQEAWRKERRHGRRWAVETVFSSFKQMFGESVYSKNFGMIQKELNAKILLYNQFRK